MKSYTDLKQSKTLEKILPLESADMLYYCNKENDTLITESPFIRSFKETNTFSYVPCWSLAALFDIFPNSEQKSVDVCHGGWKGEEYVSDWFCSYDDYEKNYFETTNSDNPVDACVEMIIKLHEQKLL